MNYTGVLFNRDVRGRRVQVIVYAEPSEWCARWGRPWPPHSLSKIIFRYWQLGPLHVRVFNTF